MEHCTKITPQNVARNRFFFSPYTQVITFCGFFFKITKNGFFNSDAPKTITTHVSGLSNVTSLKIIIAVAADEQLVDRINVFNIVGRGVQFFESLEFFFDDKLSIQKELGQLWRNGDKPIHIFVFSARLRTLFVHRCQYSNNIPVLFSRAIKTDVGPLYICNFTGSTTKCPGEKGKHIFTWLQIIGKHHFCKCIFFFWHEGFAQAVSDFLLFFVWINVFRH